MEIILAIPERLIKIKNVVVIVLFRENIDSLTINSVKIIAESVNITED